MDKNIYNSTSVPPRECAECHRPMPISYKEDICPACKERELFNEVKEYIRANDVNEYDVSSHFHIPLRKIKEWIREGRIEYKNTTEASITIHCQNCGAKINFGSLCPKCLKQLGTSAHATNDPSKSSSQGSMFFNLNDFKHR